MKDIRDQSYYELLEIEPSASQEEVLKAYNRARATYGHNSPALYSLFNKEEAQELLKLIDEAYSTLSNQFKRKQYDAKGLEVAATANTQERKNVEKFAPPKDDLAIPSAAQMTQFYESSVSDETTLTKKNFSAPNAAPASKLDHPQMNGPQSSNLASNGFDNPGSKTSPMPTTASRDASVKPQFSTQGHSNNTRAPGVTSGQTTAGTTPFGAYKVDHAFEEEIKITESFSGEVLQRIRLYKNVTLDQISDVTKISRPYLVAVESNNFSSLPAQVFLRGFLLQIAKALNLDGAKVSTSYLKLMKERQKK